MKKKVFVSLYGGDASDIDGYSWTIDNSSVASIQPTDQYCIISAKDSGYARIKITHNKATYPYYIGVYVFADATNVGYITTSNNIVTMNMDEGDKSISVSLVNGKDSSLDSQFKWEIINDEGSATPVALSANGNNAVISPKQSGSCTLRVTHPDAVYPLDILCRVITIVKNVYIQPDNTVLTLTGSSEQTVTSELVNMEKGEYNIDGFKYMLDDYNVAEIVNSVGNQVTVRGLANGSCKLVISHERTAYAREVLLIVNGQLKDAVDASCYVTTSQNYIRTKVGSDGQTINISLKGGEEGDEANFQWSVKSTAADGSSAKVIDLETATGSVFHVSARSAAPTYSYGSAFMTPLCEGTAVITITHPKIVYPTEILVKVLSKDAVLEEPLYFSGSGLLKLLNGDSQEYTVELKGNSKSNGDNANIKWECDTDYLTLATSGNIANISAPPLETGSTISYVTISHPKADANKTLLVMTADDIETLNAMKALYSDKTYYNIENGTTASCFVSTAGFEEDYDFSKLTWSVKDSSIISVEKSSFNPLSCKMTALKSGSTTLTASIEDVSCTFNITVYPKGTVNIDPEIYFTTNQNVVTLGTAGQTKQINVTAVNLKSSEYSKITWTSSDTSVATVIGNGTSATLTAVAEGESVISVFHEDSQNTLKIYVRVGSEYIILETDPVVYISASDVMTFLKGGATQSLQAVLVNYEGTDTSGFSFNIDDSSVAEISAQTPTGIAYIKPVSSGQAQVTITHTATDISKKVLIVVGNSAEELAGYVYLTTSTNVVAVGEGNTKSVSVSVKNAPSAVVDGYTWLSSNPAVVDVKGVGATAVLTGNELGTALITVTNKVCQYSLTIIAQCVDPIAAAANPYIQLSSSVLTLNVSSAFTSITADLIGGSSDDYSGFVWGVNDSSVCAVYGQTEVGKIRALRAGQTYVTVSHPKSAYTAQILVVCDEIKESECYIRVPSSILTVKPNAASQSITATLVNGTSTDKYNFGWSLDVYDVIDFQYSANVCTITPKQTGSATITISHPKAAYDQQIIVNVQEYSNFAFPQVSSTITQGTVSFLTMQVPTTSVTTHVEYSVDNEKICSISGTKAVAQVTGVTAGSTTVRAKLVASSTGVVQAESEMLVYVKEAAVNTVYITLSNTIFTVNKGKSQTLSATLTGNGITNSDQYNLKWKTSDSDIVQVTGISSDGTVSGQSIYITALKPGEALITCSHEKAASDLQFYVVVPGSAEKVVTLNKTYLTLTKGSSGTSLKANIENAESSSDYYDLVWSAETVNGSEIVRITGTGQTVTVYPMATGETTVMAQLPDTQKVAKCTVVVEAGKSLSFETSSKKVQPFHSKRVMYTVSPPDAVLTWTMAQEDDYFEYHDLGCDSDGIGFGYSILNGNLQMSEWGSTTLEEILNIPYIEMDYHIDKDATIEEMLYKGHPEYFKEYAPKNEAEKPYNFFINDAANLDLGIGAEIEPITGLTAEEAAVKYAELKEKGLSPYIGINIPGDFVFDDKEGQGAGIFTETNGHPSFYMGDNFVKELKKNDEHAQNVLATYKELYEMTDKYIMGVEKPEFLFAKLEEFNQMGVAEPTFNIGGHTYTQKQIEEELREDIQNIFVDLSPKPRIDGIRLYQNPEKNNKINILVQYDTEPGEDKWREDSLFNVIAEENILFNGMEVDVNPITSEKSGTIEEYLTHLERLGATSEAEAIEKQAELLDEQEPPLTVYTFSPFGYEGSLVTVETDLRRGIPAYDIVGLADNTVKESRERIRAAFKNSGLELPAERILQSLSPADLKKDSPMDVPMAVSILAQKEGWRGEPILALGELELSGGLRPVRGAHAAVTTARAAGISNIICDKATAELLKDIHGIKILATDNLREISEKIKDKANFIETKPEVKNDNEIEFNEDYFDAAKESLSNYDLKGHFDSIRAIEVAVAGKHNILQVGAPGCGKTLLQQNLISALTPKLTEEESKSIARINSIAGLDSPNRDKLVAPFRMPHQTASIEGICGGGPNCRPGEISLAHKGTLFLDEAAEFRSSVLQMLRVPLETKTITLSRAGRTTMYPADFQLAMATNPCPCGCYGSKDKICLDSTKSIDLYWKKFSAPLIDRVEIKNFVQRDEKDERTTSLDEMHEHVRKAYEIQRKRGVYNSHMTLEEIAEYCKLSESCEKYVNGIEDLSPRSRANLLKLSLTIANMDGREEILMNDLREARELSAPMFEKPHEFKYEPVQTAPVAEQQKANFKIDDETISKTQIEDAVRERKLITEPVLNGEKTGLYKAFKDFEDKGVFDVQGTQVKLSKNGELTSTGWKQLQAAMEIYRSKKFETFRYVMIDRKSGEIADQLAITSHMPNFCNVTLPNDETVKQVISRAEEKDYLIAVCHNHPSGNTTESSFDRELTDSLDRSLRRNDGLNRFAGHIILDHDTFNLAVPNETPGKCHWKKMEPMNVEKEDRLNAEQSPTFAGESVSGTSALKQVAEKINDTENWNDNFIPVVFTNADRNITGVQYYSKNFFENESDKIRNEFQFSAMEAGAIGAFPIITDSLWNKLPEEARTSLESKLKELIMNDAFTDAAFNKSTITEKYSIEAGRNYYSFNHESSDRKIDVVSTWTPEVNPRLFPEEHKKQNHDIER